MSALGKRLMWLSLFAIAMGFLETAVVIYLRELYYPEGFNFPLRIIPPFIGKVEFLREAATVIMLVSCGYLAGKTKLQRFAWFVLAFAIWDIFYYVFLYLCLGWPQSLATWDILFLIPVPWVGPVWAPCLLSLLMAFGAVYVIRKTEENPSFKVSAQQWWFMLAGAFVCIVSFMWDYLAVTYHSSGPWSLFSRQALFSELLNHVPAQFNWGLFCCGFFLMCLSILSNILKTNRS